MQLAFEWLISVAHLHPNIKKRRLGGRNAQPLTTVSKQLWNLQQ
jgi:hypothetical protein